MPQYEQLAPKNWKEAYTLLAQALRRREALARTVLPSDTNIRVHEKRGQAQTYAWIAEELEMLCQHGATDFFVRNTFRNWREQATKTGESDGNEG